MSDLARKGNLHPDWEKSPPTYLPIYCSSMPSSSHSQHGSSPRPSPSIGETNPNRPFIATAVGVPDMAPFSAFQPYVATSRPRTTYPPQASPFPPQTPTSSRGSCMPPTPPNGGIGKDYLMRERKDGIMSAGIHGTRSRCGGLSTPEEELGRWPTTSEVFAWTHRRNVDSSLAEEPSRKTHVVGEDGLSNPAAQESETEMWSRVVGDQNKSCIYVLSRMTSSTSFNVRNDVPDSLSGFQEQIGQKRKRMEQLDAETRAQAENDRNVRVQQEERIKQKIPEQVVQQHFMMEPRLLQCDRRCSRTSNYYNRTRGYWPATQS
ncbi:hypothetical protein CRG98_001003 [Punica granatum]|uniref:Uncharacterized protein n=1 Tax=Punica granatum TaxID=22663 RepID=A0A2I0LEH3_PUNGR|nr:hypothetical protein CRG98_001003 [Punica granatum]